MELAFYKNKEANDGNEAFVFDKNNEMHTRHRMILEKKLDNISHIEKCPSNTTMKHN
jgi:hypothetical protein